MRRSARNQALPKMEQELLTSLQGTELKLRCRELYNAGWTLSAIGDPIEKQRSTIRFWINNVPDVPTRVTDTVPTPEDRRYVPKKPASPGVSPSERETIQHLAPLARRYRAKLSSNHPSTQANEELTEICTLLHNSGVPLQELADVAGVTYRAMYRRVRSR